MMESPGDPIQISGIIPTLGRPEYLRKCLETVSRQTLLPREVLVVHVGEDAETRRIVEDPAWVRAGIDCRYFHYPERNVAAQRNFAVTQAKYPWLLLLDDDLEIEPEWTQELLAPMLRDSAVSATLGNLVNQPYLIPNSLTWRTYLRVFIGARLGDYEGRLVGAAMNLGYAQIPDAPRPIEWIGAGASAIRRSAFEDVGGFSKYFAGSSPGEDFDLGYRLSRRGKVLFIPSAKAFHHSAGQNRFPPSQQQYYLVRSKFAIQFCAMHRSRAAALGHTIAWAIFQSASEVVAAFRTRSTGLFGRLAGRVRGLVSCFFWRLPAEST